MFIVHLFVSYAHVSLPAGVRGWLRFLLVALPGLFGLPFYKNVLCHFRSATLIFLPIYKANSAGS